MTSKRKRLLYTRTPLQLTDLGLEVAGELGMEMDSITRRYLKAGFPKEALGLILMDVVRKWKKGDSK